MKKNCKKHDLSFASTMDYVRDVLENSNVLSKYLLDLVCFQDGCFYAYLPEEVELKNIHHFKSGGICSTTYEEVANLISCFMCENVNLSCIIDDVIRDPLDKNISAFGADIFFCDDEIYYLIKKKDPSVDVILKCLQETNAIWHSLCVLTASNCEDFSFLSVSKEKMQEICLMTQMIVVGAYDGEGYVFWEKC